MTNTEWLVVLKRVQTKWRNRWYPGWKVNSKFFRDNYCCTAITCLHWQKKSCVHAFLISPSDIKLVAQMDISSTCKDFNPISEGEGVV